MGAVKEDGRQESYLLILNKTKRMMNWCLIEINIFLLIRYILVDQTIDESTGVGGDLLDTEPQNS